MKKVLLAATVVALAACVDEPQGEILTGDQDVGDNQLALETIGQTLVDNGAIQANDSSNDFYGGKMTGQVNTRFVAWKQGNWTANGSNQVQVCNYGWCGFWPIGDCSRSSGDSNAGYSYGACNSTSWGERFAGFLWNGAVKANYKTKVSGTTTFGYHPYWCFQYNGATRTYEGWSYTDHCGGNYDYVAGSSGPPPPVCGNGALEAGEDCDLGANNGKMGYCCNTSCKFSTAGSVCRQTNGDCDQVETCSGSSSACPADGWSNSGGTTCNVDGDCAGLSNDPTSYRCLALSSGTKKCWRVCRNATGACDATEFCHVSQSTGSWTDVPGPSCAVDLVLAAGTACTYNGESGTCTSMGVCNTATVPAGWICDESWYGDAKCDCGCGALDSDCNAGSTSIRQNCAGGQTCTWNQVTCVQSGGTIPAGWNTTTCPTSTLGDNNCDVGCGGIDPDCDKQGVGLKEHCAAGYSASWGEKTCHNNSSYVYKAGVRCWNNTYCFNNCPKSWSTDSYCDIGCQFKDPKCGGPW